MSNKTGKPRLSTIAGLATGALIGFNADTILSYCGVPQDVIELADKTVNQEILPLNPALMPLKPVLRDITQDYMRRMNAVGCLTIIANARYCYIKDDRKYDMAVFYHLVAETDKEAKTVGIPSSLSARP